MASRHDDADELLPPAVARMVGLRPEESSAGRGASEGAQNDTWDADVLEETERPSAPARARQAARGEAANADSRGQGRGASRGGTSSSSGGSSGGRGGAARSGARPQPVSPTYRGRLVRRVLGAFGCAVCALVLGWCALQTVGGQAVDTLAMEAAMRWEELLGAPGVLVTRIVSLPMMVCVAVLIVVVAYLRHRPTLAGRALSMVVAANTTTQLAKLLVERPDFHVSTALVNSLPSGHTTVAMSFSLALVMIAPEWLRGPSAWLGWVWTSLMGVSVMVFGWHRPADVLVAILVCGAWALLLTPVESRRRHSTVLRRVMGVLALACAVAAALGTAYAVWALNVVDLAQPGVSGFAFAEFLDGGANRAHVLAGIASLWVVASAGVVIHEVDRLSGE